MYYSLPVKERIELMKKYKTAYPGMSYNEMVEHFNTVQEYGNGGKISVEPYNEKMKWMGETYGDAGINFSKNNIGVNVGNYIPLKTNEPTRVFNPNIGLDYTNKKGNTFNINASPGYVGVGYTHNFGDGGKVQPYQAKDQKDFDYRQKMYNDSAMYHNMTNSPNYMTNVKNYHNFLLDNSNLSKEEKAHHKNIINDRYKSIDTKNNIGYLGSEITGNKTKVHHSKIDNVYPVGFGLEEHQKKLLTNKPTRYVNVTKYNDNFLTGSIPHDPISRKIIKEKTAIKEDEIDRKALKKVFPKLTDEEITKQYKERSSKEYDYEDRYIIGKRFDDDKGNFLPINKYYDYEEQLNPKKLAKEESIIDNINKTTIQYPTWDAPKQKILPPIEPPKQAIGREEQTVLPTDNPRYGMIMDYSGRWVKADTRQKQYGVSDKVMKFNNLPIKHANGGPIESKNKRKPITTIEEARAYAKQNPEAFANAYVKKSGTIPSTTPTNVKAYNTIEPTSYSDYNNIRRYITNTPRDINKSVMPTADEEAWKQYLGLNNTPKTIIPSTYKPTIAKDKNASYYKINQPDNKLFQSMADYLSDYPDTTFQASEFDFLTTAEAEKNDTSNTTVGNNYSVLGNFTVSKKTDEKGRPYISYYDKYDFDSAPFPIKNALNNLGKPFEFYDRYYPKDQYESNPKTKTINRIKYGDPRWKIEKEFPDYQYRNGGPIKAERDATNVNMGKPIFRSSVPKKEETWADSDIAKLAAWGIKHAEPISTAIDAYGLGKAMYDGDKAEMNKSLLMSVIPFANTTDFEIPEEAKKAVNRTEAENKKIILDRMKKSKTNSPWE